VQRYALSMSFSTGHSLYREPSLKGRFSTIDLLRLTSLDQLWIMQTLMRRSTVLRLVLHIKGDGSGQLTSSTN
jgi:hypothetical protein